MMHFCFRRGSWWNQSPFHSAAAACFPRGVSRASSAALPWSLASLYSRRSQSGFAALHCVVMEEVGMMHFCFRRGSWWNQSPFHSAATVRFPREVSRASSAALPGSRASLYSRRSQSAFAALHFVVMEEFENPLSGLDEE